jgi:hypothetical protein
MFPVLVCCTRTNLAALISMFKRENNVCCSKDKLIIQVRERDLVIGDSICATQNSVQLLTFGAGLPDFS